MFDRRTIPATPMWRGRSRHATLLALALTSLALLLAVSAPTARAAQTVGVAVTQATGTAPLDATAGPGNDVSLTDGIVRSNDTVTYQIQVNVNDDEAGSSIARNVTVRQTLPDGLTWETLPATCLTSGVTPRSEISPDGRTITCNVGDLPTGQARTIPLVAHVDELTNGRVLTPAVDSIVVEADGATAGRVTPRPVTVSSIPRVDMVKSAPTVTEVASGGIGGVPGYLLRYPVRVTIPDFGGRGLIGYTPPAALMRLQDDFAAVSPNAEFVSCSDDSGGTWSCPAATAVSPADLAVTVTDPARLTSGTLSTTTVTIFVPRRDLEDDPDGTLQADNVLVNLDARGPDGTPAVGEVVRNNTASVVLSLRPGTGFNVYKHYVDVTRGSGRYIPGGPNVDRNGFATVGGGQIFQGEVRIAASNVVAGFDQIAACDVFDTTTQQVTLAGAAGLAAHGNGRPAWVTANSAGLVQETDFVIEYSTDATSADADQATRWDELRSADCDGGSWTRSAPATESAANDVTKVRLRFLTTPPRQFTLAFAVNLEAKPGAEGTILANFARQQTDNGAWNVPTYNPESHTGDDNGDRLILTTAQLTLAKDILDPATGPTGTPSIRGGTDVQFGLRPLVTIPSQSTTPTIVTARDVRVTDVLPAGTTLSRRAGQEPSPAPESVVTDPVDGTTTIVWNLGTLTSDDTPSITYWATVSRTASGTKVNRAIVTSPDDAGSPASVPTGSSSDPHFAARTLVINSLGGIQIEKQVDKDVIEPGDELTFTITYANLDATPRDAMDSIDVLPFNGDGTAIPPVPGRSPGSDFHGDYELTAVDAADGEEIRYTDADPAAVYATYDDTVAGQAGYGRLPAGKTWCTAADIAASLAGCPGAVGDATAIRVTRTTPLAGGENRRYSYTLRTNGNRSGDVYANTAALRDADLALGTLSETASARTVASRVGDLVWQDLDGNGRQDPGEPGVGGVRVVLDGIDKHGTAIQVETVTGADGRYLLTSSTQGGQAAGVLDLVSGRYRVTFDPATLPPRAAFTLRNAAGASPAEDSDADPITGVSAEFTLPDPSPTGTDGEDLTLDAGIVIAPAPPEPPRPPTPPTPPTPPVDPPTSPRPQPRRAAPRLKLRKVASSRTAVAGRTVRYRLIARNVGRGIATNVTLCDTLPDRVTLVGKRGGALKGGKVCWNVKRLKPGARVVRTLVVRIDRDAPAGKLVNRATLDRSRVRGIDARARQVVKVKRAPGAGVAPSTGSGGVTG